MSDPRSLSVTYYDPETVHVPEPEQVTVAEPTKRKGRPLGSKNVPKPETKRPIPWFNIWRVVFWATIAVVGVVSLYFGVEGWLGHSIALILLAVTAPAAASLLDRDWKKMRS